MATRKELSKIKFGILRKALKTGEISYEAVMKVNDRLLRSKGIGMFDSFPCLQIDTLECFAGVSIVFRFNDIAPWSFGLWVLLEEEGALPFFHTRLVLSFNGSETVQPSLPFDQASSSCAEHADILVSRTKPSSLRGIRRFR